MAEDLSARCHHQSPCVKLLAFDSVDTGRKFLACAEKVRPSSVVTNHLLDVIQTLAGGGTMPVSESHLTNDL